MQIVGLTALSRMLKQLVKRRTTSQVRTCTAKLLRRCTHGCHRVCHLTVIHHAEGHYKQLKYSLLQGKRVFSPVKAIVKLLGDPLSDETPSSAGIDTMFVQPEIFSECDSAIEGNNRCIEDFTNFVHRQGMNMVPRR